MARKMEPIEQKNITIKTTTVIAIILFLISTIGAVVIWKGRIDNRIGNLEVSDSNQEERIKKLEADNLEIKVKLASIDARLCNIESTLLEIKNKLYGI
jgi:uncharacterized coiled-coil protein SlyX